MKNIYAILLIAIISHFSFSQDWKQLGNLPENANGKVEIAILEDGTQFVAFRNSLNNLICFYWDKSSQTWEDTGLLIPSDGEHFDLVAVGNSIYIGCFDDFANIYVVLEWTGGIFWSVMGDLSSIDYFYSPGQKLITFGGSQNILSIAYINSSSDISMLYNDGGTWQAYGSPSDDLNLSIFGNQYPLKNIQIVSNQTHTYVSYINYVTLKLITIYIDETDPINHPWLEFDGDIIGDPFKYSVAVYGTNQPRITFNEGGFSDIISHKEGDGAGYTNFQQLPLLNTILEVDIEVDPSNTSYILTRENGGTKNVNLKTFDGSTFNPIGIVIDNDVTYNCNLGLFEETSKPYVILYKDFETIVKTFNNPPTFHSIPGVTTTEFCVGSGGGDIYTDIRFDDIDNDSLWFVGAISDNNSVIESTNIYVNRINPYSYTSSENHFDVNVFVSPINSGVASLTLSFTDGLDTVSFNVGITVNPKPNLIMTSDITICYGETTTLTAGGGPFTTYNWTPGGMTTENVNVTPLSFTTYNVTVVDINGCYEEGNVNVNLHPLITANAGFDQTICEGTMHVLGGSGSGGTPPLSYSWSGGITDGIPFMPVVGTTMYTLSVFDMNGCIQTDDIFLTVTTNPIADAGTNITVCEGTDVTLNGSGTGGTPPIIYNWDLGVTNGVPFSSPLGLTTYTLTATDANGCMSNDNIDVTVDPSPGALVVISTDPTSCGASDGTFTITSLTALATYDVSYNDGSPQSLPGQTANTSGEIIVTGLSAGSYNDIEVVNSFGCIGIYAGSINLTDPSAPTIGAGLDQTVCEGENVTLNAINPESAIISWDNAVIDGVPFTPGVGSIIYTVTANLAGCIATDQVTVTVNSLPIVNAGADIIGCIGEYVTLLADNPTGDNISWDFSVTNGIPFELSATSTYTVTALNMVTGCQSTDQVNITVNPLPTINMVVPTETVCLNESSFNLDHVASPIGGLFIGDFIFGNNFNANLYGVGTHNYIYQYTDLNGCTNTNNGSVIVLDIPEITLNVTNATCGSNNGSVTSTVTAGTPPYYKYWSSGHSTDDISGLSPSMYYLNVSDANGCYAMEPANVSGGTTVVTGVITNNVCNGESNGSIELNVSGSGPFTYYWSNGSTTKDISGLKAGQYEVFVYDANVCLTTASFNVGEPQKINGTITATQSTCLNSDGALSTTIIGGTLPFTFDWKNSSGASIGSDFDLLNQPAGAYKLEMLDANACQAIFNAIITDSDGPIVFVNTVTHSTCDNDGAINISINSTELIQSILWNNLETSEDISNLSVGYYNVIATDDFGCKGVIGTNVNYVLPEIQPICLVTVDTTTNTNLVVWEKPISTQISHYNIYRETSVAGQFLFVGSVNYSDESLFTDPVAYPQLRSWRYRISAVNNCGIESQLSEAHKTIHVNFYETIPGAYSVNWDQYIGTDYDEFDIYQFTSSTNWNLVNTVNNTTFNTLDTPPNVEGIDYMISITPNSICTSTKAQDHNASRSNKTSVVSGPPGQPDGLGISSQNINYQINIYPNPSTGIFNVQIIGKEYQDFEIQIYDLTGKLLLIQNVNGNENLIEIDLNVFESGMYFIQLKSTSGTQSFPIIKL